MSKLVRLLALLVMVAAMTVVSAVPASAHTSGQAAPTNYRSALTSVTPQVDGIRVRSVEAGDRFELTNNSDQEVVVLGYSDEPYLRVGKAGTFVNTISPAYFLNQQRYIEGPAPSEADATQPPQWKKISSSNVVLWHDHRTHWMSTIAPPIVRDAPNDYHVVIPAWTVNLQHGDTKIAASGKLEWIPGPSPVVWYIVIGALVALGLGAMFHPQTQRIVAIGVAVLIVGNMIQLAGSALAIPGTTSARLGDAAQAIGPLLLAWIIGGYGAVRMWLRRSDGPWFVVFGALVIAVVGGVTDFAALSASQLPTQLPDVPARALIALSTGLGCGLTIVSLVLIRRQRGAEQ